jgi:hypothetical protein
VWGVLALVGVSVPATAHGASVQVVAHRDIGVDLTVARGGRAYLVSRSDSSVRSRSAAPGRAFGPWRTLMRAGDAERAVSAGIAANGSSVMVLEGGRRLRVLSFGAQAPVSRTVRHADFAASALASSGAAVVVWFHHRADRRWRLEAATREPGGTRFGAAESLSPFVRRPCCTTVSAAMGDRGDAVVTWSSTSRPSVWATVRRPGQGFGRTRQLAEAAAEAPRAVVGANGTAVLFYSVQHVPRRPEDGLALHRAAPSGAFDAAELVNPGGGITTADAAVTPTGAVSVAWVDEVHGARAHLSEGTAGRPLVPTALVGANVRPNGLALAADADGRVVVAWSERAPSRRAYREQAMGAMRPARDAPFGPAVALGAPSRAVEAGLARLVPGGALVLWKGSRYGPPAARRTTLAVTRLP